VHSSGVDSRLFFTIAFKVSVMYCDKDSSPEGEFPSGVPSSFRAG
jgi:hypothetical protein